MKRAVPWSLALGGVSWVGLASIRFYTQHFLPTMQGWPQDTLAASRYAGPAMPSHTGMTCQRLRASNQHACAYRHQRRRPREQVRRAQCSSSPLVAEDEHEEGLQPPARTARPPQSVVRRGSSAQVATLRATKASTLDVEEEPRPLGAALMCLDHL